ncbi:TIM44-like domain-containing protein [Siccirubricoccus sp. KC 17139]|uniref:TIM44-like domain-containing protein n=1 Tax=Siccirubricoccus soli TaxID=2899147 RepID=A0ABT1D9V2_9PROT|nr:TIM44-like domain-containing protein [Siccirubricoccus soli]MCO6418722.1 TIM44-like domain-containing protein [Siccirubricoccus soli]MCP2684857.1 TIM44-like domain-containing protein [Siccirubricoccus soli]
MPRPRLLLAALAAAALALAPALTEARPGGGSSMGSRGARTYSPPPSTQTTPGGGFRPMDRTMESPTRPATPGYAQPAPRAPIGRPNPQGGFFSRSPFMAGLMGGLIGAGIGGLLFGHGLFGGFTGFASFLGLLLQIALIAGLVWLVMGFLRRRQPQPAMAGMAPGLARNAMAGDGPGSMGAGRPGAAMAGSAGPDAAPVRILPEDFNAFEQALKAVNDAWSRRDAGTLQRLATPEMARYFADDLADLAARGWHNETRDVRLEQGDLAEAWREGDREFATVAMRFSLVDVTWRLADRAVMEGDPNRRTVATELWTFTRRAGGPWQLSAIQQAG